MADYTLYIITITIHVQNLNFYVVTITELKSSKNYNIAPVARMRLAELLVFLAIVCIFVHRTTGKVTYQLLLYIILKFVPSRPSKN